MLTLRRSSRFGLLVVLSTFLSASMAQAQTVTGTITGTIVDSTGATLPGTTVTVTNEATGAERILVTTANGVFIFTSLPPTTYSVKVQLSGFRPLTRTGLTLTAGDRLALGNIELALGELTEAVTVTGETAMVNTESADVTATLGTAQLNDLVVKGREFMNVVKLLPGVSQTGGGDIAGGTFGIPSPQVGGIRSNYNNMTLDGARGNDPGTPGTFSTGVAVDAIGEIKILTSTYLAETGPNPGASIKLTTKSGTREFHGTGYFFKRDDAMNANDFFVNRQGLKPFDYQVTTGGVTLGGPIYIPRMMNTDRSKLFFFYNSEITRSLLPRGLTNNSPPAVLQYTVPTALERQGDFSQSVDTNGQLIVVRDPRTGLPFPGNIIPADRINSNGQKLLGVFPLPNTTDVALTGRLYNYQFKNTQDVPKQSHTLKFDYVPSNKDMFSARLKKWISDTKSYTGIFGYNNFPLTYYDYYFRHDDAQLSWTRVLTPRMVNEVSFAYTYSDETGAPRGDRTHKEAFRDTYGITLGQLYPASNPYNILPAMSFTGISNPVLFNYDQRTPISAKESFWELTDNLSVNRGTHALKFGVYVHGISTNEGVRANNFSGNLSFDRNPNNPGDTNHPYANALLGNFQSYQEASRKNLAQSEYFVAEFYAQDQWKATRKLTLSYGARFSSFDWYHLREDQVGSALALENYDPAKTPRQYVPAIVNGVRVGRDPVSGATVPVQAIGAFVAGTGDPANGAVTNADVVAGKYPQGWVEKLPIQVSPRFGFGYDLFGNGNTAIRGGIGVGRFVLGAAGAAINQQGFNQPYVVVSQQFNGNLDALQSTQGFVFPSTMGSFNRSRQVPTIYNWSLGVQQLLPGKFIVDLSYVGNTQRWIENDVDLNTLPPGARFAPENRDPTTGGSLPDNLIRPRREYTVITYRDSSATSDYHSFQVQVNRRYDRGLATGVAYTLSKSHTNEGTINPFVPTEQWLGAPQSFDQTHVLVTNFQWQLPNASRLMPNPVVKGVLDNWEVSGIYTLASGFPMSVTVSSSAVPDISGSSIAARPDMVPNVDPNSGPKTFAKWFNTDAFAMPATGTFGNAPVFPFRGPGINNVDVALMKRIPLGGNGSRHFRIRIEAYNALNHTQFNGINTAARFDAAGNQINSQFGQATSALQPRVIQLGGTLTF
jgi:Carboxypeptidase regulatory-like domain